MLDTSTIRTAAADAGLTRCPVGVKHVTVKGAYLEEEMGIVLIFSPLHWVDCNSSGLFEIAVV